MIAGPIISPFPFYDSIEKQNHRKSYAYGQVFPLVTNRNFLLPFQEVLQANPGSIQSAKLVNFDDGTGTDILQSLLANGLRLTEKDGYSILSYPANFPVNELTQEGPYYLVIGIGGGSIYSEVFSSTNRITDFLMLEYGNSSSLKFDGGEVDFTDGFKFRMYLDTQVGKPRYTFDEESTERMGRVFIESQVSKKTRRFTFAAPEYLCDAARIIRLCDNRTITSMGETFHPVTFEMDVEWDEQGYIATVDCEFDTDPVFAGIGGNWPRVPTIFKDFNTDFNNDLG